MTSFTSQTSWVGPFDACADDCSSVFEPFSVDGENAAKTIVRTRSFWCVFDKNGAFRKRISVDGPQCKRGLYKSPKITRPLTFRDCRKRIVWCRRPFWYRVGFSTCRRSANKIENSKLNKEIKKTSLLQKTKIPKRTEGISFENKQNCWVTSAGMQNKTTVHIMTIQSEEQEPVDSEIPPLRRDWARGVRPRSC